MGTIRCPRTIAGLLLLIWLQVSNNFVFKKIYLVAIFLEIVNDLKVGLGNGKVEIFLICKLARFKNTQNVGFFFLYFCI